MSSSVIVQFKFFLKAESENFVEYLLTDDSYKILKVKLKQKSFQMLTYK